MQQFGGAQAAVHKDKLSETKRAEKELREAHKEELHRKKAAKAEETSRYKATLRDLRALDGNSKRAEREKREALKKEAHRESGQECMHGIWKCKICFPHPTGHAHNKHVATH